LLLAADCGLPNRTAAGAAAAFAAAGYLKHVRLLLKAFPGAHALLIGLPCSNGRSTLTKLAAYAAQCKVFMTFR